MVAVVGGNGECADESAGGRWMERTSKGQPPGTDEVAKPPDGGHNRGVRNILGPATPAHGRSRTRLAISQSAMGAGSRLVSVDAA